MLDYNKIKEGRYIVLNQEPYAVLSAHIFRKQQRKPVNAAKLKHLITGKVIEYSFHQSDKAEEAQIDEKEAIYLYQRREEYWFADPDDKSRRFKLAADEVQDRLRFIAPNTLVKILSFNNQFVGVKTPIKATLKVKEAAETVRGNTVQGGTKKVILENGARLETPLFIKAGDNVIVNTATGEYVSRGEGGQTSKEV